MNIIMFYYSYYHFLKLRLLSEVHNLQTVFSTDSVSFYFKNNTKNIVTRRLLNLIVIQRMH